MDNEEVFDLEVVMFNDATGGENVENMNAVDMSLKLMIGRMKAVYLHRFIMELLVCFFSFLFSFMTICSAQNLGKETERQISPPCSQVNWSGVSIK